jgi:Cytosol aminopeptidase family, catalytic domain
MTVTIFEFDVIFMVFLLKQSVATGKHHAAILTNNDAWEDALVTAGLASGDLTFPLPFCPEFHFSEFASAVADMKNSVAVSFFCIHFRADFSIRTFFLGSKQCHFVLRWIIHPFAPRIRFPRDLDAC